MESLFFLTSFFEIKRPSPWVPLLVALIEISTGLLFFLFSFVYRPWSFSFPLYGGLGDHDLGPLPNFFDPG